MENNQIKGIFVLKREYGNNVSLQNKNTNGQEFLDYFIFRDKLAFYFPIEKVEKILEHINCGRRVLIDFDKKIAKLIVEKEFNFKKALDIYFDPMNIENDLQNLDDQDIYSRFKDL